MYDYICWCISVCVCTYNAPCTLYIWCICSVHGVVIVNYIIKSIAACKLFFYFWVSIMHHTQSRTLDDLCIVHLCKIDDLHFIYIWNWKKVNACRVYMKTYGKKICILSSVLSIYHIAIAFNMRTNTQYIIFRQWISISRRLQNVQQQHWPQAMAIRVNDFKVYALLDEYFHSTNRLYVLRPNEYFLNVHFCRRIRLVESKLYYIPTQKHSKSNTFVKISNYIEMCCMCGQYACNVCIPNYR